MTRMHQPYVFGPGEGTKRWSFLGTLMTLKAGTEDTEGRFTLLEQYMPPGFSPPAHIHHHEDEVFGILEGELTVWCADRTWTARPGMTVFLPQGIVHGFRVSEAGPARMWHLTAPSGFEHFVEEVGEPALSAELPLPGEVDTERVVEIAARYGYELLPEAVRKQ